MNIARILIPAAACVLLSSQQAPAQVEINWYTMDAGGGVSSGGGYTLNGTIGQGVDVGRANTGINTKVSGGYWEGGVIVPPCGADFNQSGAVTVQDIYDFLFAWNAMDFAADYNQNNLLTVQDIYDFLFAWSLGCP